MLRGRWVPVEVALALGVTGSPLPSFLGPALVQDLGLSWADQRIPSCRWTIVIAHQLGPKEEGFADLTEI